MAYRYNPLTNQFEQESNTFNSDEILAYVNNRINDLIAGADTSLDTLAELAGAIQRHEKGDGSRYQPLGSTGRLPRAN